jgi:stage IV sporulation protein FB
MLGEPAPSQGDFHFNLFGIPIRIHPFFWLVAAILGSRNSDVPKILIWVVAVLISIIIHELGHALVIKTYGFHPWIVLYGMGGLTCHDPREKYNSKANSTLGQVSISIAGPLAGFLLAAMLLAVLYLAGFRHQIEFVGPFNLRPFWFEIKDFVGLANAGIEFSRRADFVNDILYISIFWGLVNLMPVYPLDGGHIIREFLLYMNPQEGIRQSLILSIFTAGLIAIFALFKLHENFLAIFFAYMAYESYTAMQAYSQGGRW